MNGTEVFLLLFPIVLGFGTSMLFTNNRGMQCGPKAPIIPPPWVFIVAWSLLYLLLGVSSMLLWRAGDKTGLILNMILVACLVSWWVLFANVCMPVASFVCIVLLAALVFATIFVHLKHKMYMAAWTLVPLVLWLNFASFLTSFSL